jgi:type IV secretory pathway VirB2 component (pilin)
MKNFFTGTVGRALTLLGTLSFSSMALAQAAGGGTLPWEGPLQTLATSLTGPVARSIGVVAIAVCGGMLAFGGELNEITKRILMVVLALTVLLLGSGFITGLGLPSGGPG